MKGPPDCHTVRWLKGKVFYGGQQVGQIEATEQRWHDGTKPIWRAIAANGLTDWSVDEEGAAIRCAQLNLLRKGSGYVDVERNQNVG